MDFVRRQAPLNRIGQQLGWLGKFLPLVLDVRPQESERLSSPEGKGYIFCGPRYRLPQGSYSAYFWIDIGEGVITPRLVFDAVCWQDDTPTTAGELIAAIPTGPSRIALFLLRFEFPKASQVELRAWSDASGSGLTVGRIQIRRFDEWQLAIQEELKIAPPVGTKRLKRDDPGNFEAVLQRGWGENAPLELWLTFRPVAGNIHIQSESTSGLGSLIEADGAARASQFVLKDGRSVIFVPLPLEAFRVQGNRLAVILNRRRIHLDIPREEMYPNLLADSRIAHRSSLRANGAADIGGTGTAVRLKLWGLDERLNPPPESSSFIWISEKQKEFVELKEDVAAEFYPSHTGFFLFGTGPDCGIAELEWGPVCCRINLFEPSPGAMVVFVPEDMLQAGSAKGKITLSARRESTWYEAAADTLDIIALGHKHPASYSTEVALASLWLNYPLERIPLELGGFAGDREKRDDGILLRRGAGRFRAGEMPAVQLVRQNWGGLCAIGYRDRLIVVDLYSPERETILVLPAALDPILSARTQKALPGDGIVHPALAHVFRRMRPSWLSGNGREEFSGRTADQSADPDFVGRRSDI